MIITEIKQRIGNIVTIFNEPPKARQSTSTQPETPYELLYERAESFGFTTESGSITEEQARATLEGIMNTDATPALKYDMLHVLDIQVQNWNDMGLACPVISEILGAQYECVKQMESE
jgi:hypothetical protein